jgi:5-methylcytosine-specific restriction endonuclease McrA
VAVSSIPPINPAIMHSLIIYGLAIGAMGIGFEVLKVLTWEKKRKQRKKYYNEDNLQSDEWKRKRYTVLKRDNWTCVYCGQLATQVHHKRYARRNIGKEPIKWLVSVCEQCHENQHEK